MPDWVTARRHWTFWMSGYLLVFFAAYLAVMITLRGRAQVVTMDLSAVVLPLLVSVFCIVAGVKAGPGRGRLFWMLIGAAHVCALLGEASRAYYQVAKGVGIPFPSVADSAWVVFYSLVLAAILVLASFKGLTRLKVARQLLDALLFAIAVGALCWVALVAPHYHSGEGVLANLIGIGHSAGDMLLFLGLGAIWLSAQHNLLLRGLGWLCPGLMIIAIADTGFALLAANGTYQTGGWWDSLWLLGYTLAGWGVLGFLRSFTREKTGERSGAEMRLTSSARALKLADRVHIVLPYLALPAIAAMLTVRFIVHAGHGGAVGDAVTIGIAVLLTGIILMRQLLVVLADSRERLALRRCGAPGRARHGHRALQSQGDLQTP